MALRVQTLRVTTLVVTLAFLFSLMLMTRFQENLNISKQPTLKVDPEANLEIPVEEDFNNVEVSEEQQLFYSFHPDCPCRRKGRSLSKLESSFSIEWLRSQLQKRPVSLTEGDFVGASSCNDYTTSLGAGQYVRAYSLYFPWTSKSSSAALFRMFASTIPDLSSRMKTAMPKWRMRIYTNVSKERQPEAFQLLCNVTCNHEHVDVCQVSNLPKGQPMFYDLSPSLNLAGVQLDPLDDFSNMEMNFNMGMWWRFIPVADPTVRYYSSRDLDSYILDRELKAMEKWMASGIQFHTMRDMPDHRSPILGGLWDMDIYKDFAQAIRIRAIMFDKAIFKTFGTYPRDYSLDQKTLATKAYGVFYQDVMAHTSYHLCGRIHSTPWPTKRENQSIYVGMGARRLSFIQRKPLTPCPLLCRPKDHKDWTYC